MLAPRGPQEVMVGEIEETVYGEAAAAGAEPMDCDDDEEV